jgi:hypothetical protein
MKSKLIGFFTLAAINLVASTSVLADGFVCESIPGDIRVRVYNSTQPSVGTRTFHTMVISDPRVNYGRKTIARFDRASSAVKAYSSTYHAEVATRLESNSGAGELIGPTKLGQLKAILLNIDFKYSAPIANGAKTTGKLTLIKNDNDLIQLDMDCIRYLKN